MREQTSSTNLLEELEHSVEALITQEDRENYQPADEFVEQCKELRDSWIELGNTTHQVLNEAKEKVSECHGFYRFGGFVWVWF